MSLNGKLPTADLMAVPAVVAGSGFLRLDAGSQYGMLAKAFERRFGKPLTITEGYRVFGRQVDYWNAYQAGTGNLAAYPGTSNHGWAIACDFGAGVASANSAEKKWMDANAPAYGWDPTGNTFSRPEPWHFDYTGNPRITTGPSIFDTARQPEPTEPPQRKANDMDAIAVILDNPSAKTDPLYASTGVLVGGVFRVTSRASENRGVYEAMLAVAKRSGGEVQELSVDRTGWNQYALFEKHDAAQVDTAALTSSVLTALDGKLAPTVSTASLSGEIAQKVADVLSARLRG